MIQLLRSSATLLVLSVIPSLGWAGTKKPSTDLNTPEGRYLEKIQEQSDLSKRLMLLELFPDVFPTSPSLAYIWSQLQAGYYQAGKLDKALAVGSNVLVLDPDSLDAACLNWRIAADMKDAAQTAAWMARSGNVA